MCFDICPDINCMNKRLRGGTIVEWYLGLFPHCKNMQGGGQIIGLSKLPEGVNGCLSLYVSPAMN